MSSSLNKFVRFKAKTLTNVCVRYVSNINSDLNIEYLRNPINTTSISENIHRRKGVGNIQNVINLHEKLQQLKENTSEYNNIKQEFINEALKIPNESHKDIIGYENPEVLKLVGTKKEFNFKPKEFHEITRALNLMRTSQLGNVAGTRSYYFYGALAELEQALIQYTVKKLLKNGFNLLSVPDILPANIIESCGMTTKGERTQFAFSAAIPKIILVHEIDKDSHTFSALLQRMRMCLTLRVVLYNKQAVYRLENTPDLCLSGTSEMAIAGFFKDKILEKEKLPIKIAAVSRCYRAETSSVAEEKGIYRVHQFTKVEMFAVTHPDDSDPTLESFREFEEEHFSSLGLHLQVLDMPPYELGAPAYRKYDVEAWLPGRKIYGEVSSCSNCTDFQARRLKIKYNDNGELKHVHTVNGTALAVPRILIALLETYQNLDNTVDIPDVLKPFLRFDRLGKEKRVPELKLKKMKR